VLTRGPNAIGGWAVHEWRRVRCVLVTVDGEPHTWVTDFYERPDVAERWGEFPHLGQAAWTAILDLTDHAGDQVEVSAYALLEPKRSGSRRLGPVHHIGTRTCAIGTEDGTSGLSVGTLHRVPWVSPGFVRVHGHVQGEDDVATVLLVQDGRPAGLARTTPVGATVSEGGTRLTSTRLDGVVEVSEAAARTVLTAEVTLTSGDTFTLTPWEVEVRQVPPPPRPDAARLALVRQRTQARLDAQRAARHDPPATEPSVLVATHDLALGGGQLYLHELMRRLLKRGGLRFAVTSPRSGVLTDELESLGVPVLITGPTQVRDPEGYEDQVLSIASWAVEHGCHAALANTVTAFTGVDAAVRLGLPVTWAIHESFPFGQFWMEAYGAGEAHPYVIERARANLGATRRAVFEAHQTLHFYEPLLAPGAGVVVPYGVDLGEIEQFRDGVDREALRAELGIGADTLALLCMGTIEPRKGQLNLAQAFAGSAALRGSDCELVFVGAVEGAPYAEELRQLVDSFGTGPGAPRIRVEPVQPEINRWYHACDVLVCASDVESLPRSMLEAMAFGRPVASTAVFGIPELVEDGVSGFLCQDRDLGALREMLERVGDTDRGELAAMGARARDVVTTRHDPAIYEDYYLEELASGAESLGRSSGAGG
jgi:D-inositol-3-phosphate glycosyltransferase